MSFLPVRMENGKLRKVGLVASATVAKGDALAEDGNGYYQRATSSTAYVPYVAMEGKTGGSSAGDLVTVLETEGVEFVADTNANPSATDVGTFADLTDHDTLNESSSSVDVFEVLEIKGSTSDNTVFGRFTQHEGTIS